MGEPEAEKPLKILVSGDVEGKLVDLYSRVKSIQSKVGKFDLLFCVGEFFAESEKDNKEIEDFISDPSSSKTKTHSTNLNSPKTPKIISIKTVPIQTYVLGPNDSKRYKYFHDKSGYDLCSDKIIYLGPKGYYSTIHGLSIVYLSGVEEKRETFKKLKKSPTDTGTSTSNNDLVEFDLKDIEGLINNVDKINPGECIDILLTNQWPMHVESLSNQTLENKQDSEKFGSELISHLALKLKPRYHFSASQNLFFERIPYRNHQILAEKEKHMTRFLALAKVNKSNKPKFLYAFNLTPANKMNYVDMVRQTVSTVSSNNPYSNELNVKNDDGSKYYAEHDVQPSLQYFYDAEYIEKMNQLQEMEMLKHKRRMEASKNKELEPCWFCLGGTKIERQYIVSVGDKCYLAYAKGAINKDHLLIIPIDHVQSTIHAEEKLLEDINKYKLALKNYFQSKNKCVVFYERNFRTKHMQIQVYAIHIDKCYLLKDAFMSAAKEQDVRLNEIPEFTNLKQILSPNQPFYYLEIPNEDDDDDRNSSSASKSKLTKSVGVTRYLCEVRGSHFPINFGRDVMACELLLNCPDRIDWKECVMTPEEEKQMSVEFRTNFKKFDPSL